MTDEERDAWAGEVLDKIRLHRRRDVSGLLSMLDEDLADCLDALVVAPLLLNEHRMKMEMVEIERRRLAWLERYKVRDIGGDDDAAGDGVDGGFDIRGHTPPASPPGNNKGALWHSGGMRCAGALPLDPRP